MCVQILIPKFLLLGPISCPVAAIQVPANNATLYKMVSSVLLTTDEPSRKRQWADILTVLHEQAVFLPISYLVNVAIFDERYKNFAFGAQQYDLPVHRLIDSERVLQETAAVAASAKAAAGAAHGGSGGSGLSGGAVAGIVISLAVVAAVAVAAVAVLVLREKKGNPIFTPLLADMDMACVDSAGGGGRSAPVESRGSKDMAVEIMEQRV